MERSKKKEKLLEVRSRVVFIVANECGAFVSHSPATLEF